MMMPGGGACMTPVPGRLLSDLRSVSRRRVCFACRLLAAPGADGDRQRRRGQDHLQHAADAGREPARWDNCRAIACRASGAFYHATLGGARCGWKKIGNFQLGKGADFVVN